MFKTNRRSLIFSVRIIELIASFLLIVVTLAAIYGSFYFDRKREVDRAVMLYQTLFEQDLNSSQFQMYIDMNHITPISMDRAMEVMQKGTYLIDDKLLRKTFQSGNIEIFTYEDHCFYAYKKDTMFYYRSDAPMTPIKLYIALFALLTAFLLYYLHRYIVNAVKPLQRLHEDIIAFGEGDKTVNTRVKGSDEVANVSNAFADVVEKLNLLEQSRTLFLRNVLHELKTPITKGKLITVMLDEKVEDKKLLTQVFDQMEQHLSDLVRLESFSAEKLMLDKKMYAAIDIYEEVIEKLDIVEGQIEHNIDNQTIYVDFELFSLAFKNLVDNARKYATKEPIQIEWNESKIEVSNYGNALEESFETYLEPFKRDKSHSALEGLGLGLYITKEIITKHGYTISYRYKEGKHIFSICL